MFVPKRRLQAAVLGVALALTFSLSRWLSSRPVPRYTVTDLGVLPGDAESGAYGIDSLGDVVGVSLPQPGRVFRKHIFLSRSGRMTDLGLSSLLGGPAINSKGEVTGNVTLNGQNGRPFLYSAAQMRDLGNLPGCSMGFGNSVNDRGQIVGEEIGLSSSRAFFYEEGKLTDLGALPGSSNSAAQSINAVGQVAGYCYTSHSARVRCAPFLYDSRSKTMTALFMPPPYTWGYVSQINDRGQVAGNISALDEVTHAALWSGGHVTDLGTPPGFSNSVAQGLNNQGIVVGRCFNDYSPTQIFLRNHLGGDNALGRYLNRDTTRAFVYQAGKMQNLNELIPEDADWILENARGINDRGLIVGQGLHHGQERAFLLTPRP